VPADRTPGERRSRGGKAAHGRRKTRGSRG
jgi:hypothetical protein